jgi:hypothetical protein
VDSKKNSQEHGGRHRAGRGSDEESADFQKERRTLTVRRCGSHGGRQEQRSLGRNPRRGDIDVCARSRVEPFVNDGWLVKRGPEGAARQLHRAGRGVPLRTGNDLASTPVGSEHASRSGQEASEDSDARDEIPVLHTVRRCNGHPRRATHEVRHLPAMRGDSSSGTKRAGGRFP